ncbi:carboxypeptidase-like regulatory domain-containing protein [Lacibacter sp. H407]|uniref:carboxypeptidase-like regulatory domain-containing protein n=1 Tax=Lacibacter sp. H407 TaxID=3133423 RepID=UPI0030BCE1BA
MLPVQVEFPKFVADQLLTSEDLNQLFGYLDEQNRITRTNLIGIGIVCGLQMQINNTKTQVTITKGCGVTSEGHLISVNTKSYTQYKKYKVDTARVYDKFYKLDGSGNKIPMDVWELKQPAVDPDLEDIDEGFLKDKVILLFVELKEEDNKNCDPNSCDDKGINVTVSFLPMAVTTEDAKLLMGTTAGSFAVNTYTALPEIRMKRWDVTNTSPVYSQDIFQAYFKVLDKPFLDQVETTLKNVYSVFGTIVGSDYASNPFTGLATKFSYLHDGSINLNQLIHLQYHYDLFSDLLLAYQEFRRAGTHVLSTCCPDSDLFPRHLLLGEAIPSVTSGVVPYRHYFIYSPLFDQQGMVDELKSLFKRLVLLIDSFFLPTVSGNNTKEDASLRITPSMLWDVPLSKKAIPYYYLVNSGAQPLYLSWDHRRTLLHDAKRHLSYHAALYNNGVNDDFVRNPLQYDLEPYNFLRVEGIVGKSYVHVLKQVKQQIQRNRLPVDIIALSTDTASGFSNQFNSVANRLESSKDAMEMLCHFQDLESMYDSMRREILCMLCKELKYYYDFTFTLVNAFFRKMSLAGELSTVDLFDVCDKGYVIKENSLGVMIEFLHRKGLTDETLTIESFFQAFGINVQDINNDDIPDNLSNQASTIYLALLNFFKIPLGIIRLSTLLTEDLSEFDVKAYCSATEKLGEYAKSLKSLFTIITGGAKAASTVGRDAVTNAAGASVVGTNSATTNTLATNPLSGNTLLRLLSAILLVEDFLDHLDVLIYNCKCSALLSLKKDYMKRYLMLTRLRQFGYFNKLHPGLQHKAGVPMGGTFVIVYHARSRSRGNSNLSFVAREASAERRTFSATNNLFTDSTETFIEKKTSIAGFVLDEANDAVAGAKVYIAETNEGTLTAANGSFRFTGSILPYTLVVEAIGYEVHEVVKTDDDTNMRIILREAKDNLQEQLQQGMVIADFYLPYRCCSDCPPIQYIVNDVVAPDVPNKGPVANAGPDQTITLPQSQVTLDGSASTDPDGSITFFQWAKLVGPGNPAIVTQNSSQTDVRDLEEGIYVFELSVTDDKGAIARDTMQVTVNPPPAPENKPPVADAGQDQTIVLTTTNNAVILDGSNSKDEDGTIVAFKWNQLSGPSNVTIVTPTLVQTVVTGLQPGVYQFELIVTDNNGATDTDTVTITVAAPANQPPVANAGADQVVTLTATNGAITLNGTASTDPEGAALTFNWTRIAGPNTPVIVTPNLAITSVTGLVAGTYSFELKVTDDKGASDSDTVTVQVQLRDTTPQKVCGPLPDIIKLFDGITDVDPNRFSTFINADGFVSFGNVKELFEMMRGIVSSSVDKQIEFFANPINGVAIQDSLIKWLTELQRLIVNRKDLRLLALAMYRILNQLAMYIVCIQKEDFDVAKVPMNRVFAIIQRHTSEWAQLIATGVFAPAEMSMVKAIAEDINREMQRTQANGEALNKPKYLRLMKQILDILRSVI